MRSLITLLTAVAITLAPLAAPADNLVRTVNYRTAYRQVAPMSSAGEYAGHMTLRFYSSGIVNGTYRDESAGSIHTVTGGLNGTKIWLSLGNRGQRNVNGTIEKGGLIRGMLTGRRGPVQYEFTATPVAH
jgi:hypothetical protein